MSSWFSRLFDTPDRDEVEMLIKKNGELAKQVEQCDDDELRTVLMEALKRVREQEDARAE